MPIVLHANFSHLIKNFVLHANYPHANCSHANSPNANCPSTILLNIPPLRTIVYVSDSLLLENYTY